MNWKKKTVIGLIAASNLAMLSRIGKDSKPLSAEAAAIATAINAGLIYLVATA